MTSVLPPNPELPEQLPVTPSALPPPLPTPSKMSRGEMLFLACETLILALASLNNGLRIISTTTLAADLAQDRSYANQISGIKLVTVPAGTGHSHAVASAENANKLTEQQVLQAKLKAHQNQEQIDIQSATSLSTDMQQLASVITSIFQLISQIANSISQMSR